MVAAGTPPISGRERLDDDERRLERLLLGLRTAEGVPGSSVEAGPADALVGAGVAERRGERFVLTDRGMLLANEAVLALAGS
jgi:oxygen-independent coproporphyrinogen-3 oxidase